MRSNCIDDYLNLSPELQIDHDIREGLKMVHAPKRLQVRDVFTRHHRDPQERVSPQDLHQTFRYGILVDAEADVTADLQAVMDWLKERLQ